MLRLFIAALLAGNGAHWPTSGIANGGAAAGAAVISGACTTMASGQVCCVDKYGEQCGWPSTNAAPLPSIFSATSASPISTAGNQTGADLVLIPGNGIATLACTVANCGAADNVQVKINGATTTCTRDAALDDATHFTCGATDQAMCQHVAACLGQATGLKACAGSDCTLFTGVDGTAYFYRASDEPGVMFSLVSSGNHAVATNGTTGKVKIYGASDVCSMYEGTNGVFNIDNSSGISFNNSGTLGGGGWQTSGTLGVTGLITGTTGVAITGGTFFQARAGGSEHTAFWSRSANIASMGDANTSGGTCEICASAGGSTSVLGAGSADIVTVNGVATFANGVNLSGSFVLQTTMPTIVLGSGATVITPTRNIIVVDGDAGGNTVATMSGIGTQGTIVMHFIDASVTITDTNDGASNTFDLNGDFVSADDAVLMVSRDGSVWKEDFRNQN